MKRGFFLSLIAFLALATALPPLTSYAMMSSQREQEKAFDHFFAATIIDMIRDNTKKTLKNAYKTQDLMERIAYLAKFIFLIEKFNCFIPLGFLKEIHEFLNALETISPTEKEFVRQNLRDREEAIQKEHTRLAKTWDQEFLAKSEEIFEILKKKMCQDFQNMSIKNYLEYMECRTINKDKELIKTKETELHIEMLSSLQSARETTTELFKALADTRKFTKEAITQFLKLKEKEGDYDPQNDPSIYSVKERLTIQSLIKKAEKNIQELQKNTKK